jgi:DNA-binding NtrC family response regulator
MSESIVTAGDLRKLLDGSADPLYVIDPGRRIVYYNEELARWTGVGLQDLIGQRVDYHSHGEGSRGPGVALGLCPPPAVFSGQETTGHVSCMSSGGRLLHRRARFVPFLAGGLDQREASRSVMVFVSTVDVESLAEDVGGASALGADRLHAEIQRFRYEQAYRYDMDRLVGRSAAARRVRAQVEIAAASDATVLICGPPGSGRSHVARTIHHAADRARSARLIPLECGALSSDVLRQTLDEFMSRPSAALPTSVLFLAVDRLPVDQQAQLVERIVGRPPGARLFATSETRLDLLARQGRFRADLACMLSTITIELPPLDQRREDLPLLTQLFLEELNRAGGKQVGRVASEALETMLCYGWPGGVDELAEVMEASHERAEGHEIGLADLPARLRHAAQAARHPRRSDEPIVLDDVLKRVEMELIRRALKQTGGNKARAAKLLGLTRPRLYRRMVQLGLEPRETRDVLPEP